MKRQNYDASFDPLTLSLNLLFTKLDFIMALPLHWSGMSPTQRGGSYGRSDREKGSHRI